MDDREAYEYYADPENRRPAGPAYKRQRPRRQLPVRTFACPHFSVSNVMRASCETCGRLKAVA